MFLLEAAQNVGKFRDVEPVFVGDDAASPRWPLEFVILFWAPEFQLLHLSAAVTSKVGVDSASNDADAIFSVVSRADICELTAELRSEGVDCTSISPIDSGTLIFSAESSAATTTTAVTEVPGTLYVIEMPLLVCFEDVPCTRVQGFFLFLRVWCV